MADQALSAVVCGLALFGSGVIVADEPEAPELEFLEYLGMWEETDEDWQVLNETMAVDNEERSDPVPEGEESTEKEDES